MAGKNPAIELLVLASMTPEHQERLREQVAVLHPKLGDQVVVTEWDASEAPHKGAKPRMWRYAAAEVYEAYVEGNARAASEWQSHWEMVPSGLIAKKLKLRGEVKPLPMWLCTTGRGR